MAQDPARRGLGRGLELLMGAASAEAELVQLPVGSIVAGQRQPRRRFDAAALAELTESVRAQGVVQPVLVRPLNGGYELIAGERRWRAAQAAGLPTVPAVIRSEDDADALMLALVENVAREDLSAAEEARGYAALMEEFDMSLGDVAGKMGRSKPSVSNRIRLLELPDDVIELIDNGTLSEGHARAVLALPDHASRSASCARACRCGPPRPRLAGREPVSASAVPSTSTRRCSRAPGACLRRRQAVRSGPAARPSRSRPLTRPRSLRSSSRSSALCAGPR